jgi:hypothetical protein
VVGLDAGTDDCLAKPFGLAESSRLRALLGVRRSRGRRLSDRRLRVEVDARRVRVGDQGVALTGRSSTYWPCSSPTATRSCRARSDGGGLERGQVRLDEDPRRHHRPARQLDDEYR